MKKTLMKKQNWILVAAGIAFSYIGFFMISFITRNYDGLYAFISMLTLISGLIIVILGLSLGFEAKEDMES